MAVSAKRQAWFWGIAFAVFVLALWLIGSTLLPYLAGAAIAYFLDPLVDRLQRWFGLGRHTATAIIAVTALLLLAVFLVFAVPALIQQVQGLITAAPDILAKLIDFLSTRLPRLFRDNSLLKRNLAEIEGVLRDGGVAVLNQVLQGSLKVIDFFVLVLITPVVTFYLLLDWDRLVAEINRALPREHAPTVRRLAREVDAVLAGFVRGQLSVCLILGIYYAVALMVIGLPFGFLVGMLAGLISFIPFVGAILGVALSLAIAIFQFWDDKIWILVTGGTFVFGHLVEANILQPGLVGKSVGLHPVWLLLALSVFGALFGFAGLLVAVPVAATLGVIGRFLIEQYLASALYTGRQQPPPEEG